MCSCSWPQHRSERSASHSVTLPRAAQTPARPRTVLESFLALIISRFSGEENGRADQRPRSEEHTSELQSLMRNSYPVFCLQQKTHKHTYTQQQTTNKHKHTNQ